MHRVGAKAILLSATAICASLLLAACGGGGSAQTAQPASTESATPIAGGSGGVPRPNGSDGGQGGSRGGDAHKQEAHEQPGHGAGGSSREHVNNVVERVLDQLSSGGTEKNAKGRKGDNSLGKILSQARKEGIRIIRPRGGPGGGGGGDHAGGVAGIQQILQQLKH
jgi:hypothetical protein